MTPVMTIQSTARVLRTLRTLRQTKNQGAHLRNIVANPEWPRRVFAGTALLMDATNVASRLKRNGNALASSSASVYPRCLWKAVAMETSPSGSRSFFDRVTDFLLTVIVILVVAGCAILVDMLQ